MLAKHVAICMDGNRRWAKKRSLSAITGHKAGMSALKSVIKEACCLDIDVLSIFAFSQDNWSRGRDETKGLMQLMLMGLDRESKLLHAQGIKIQFIGNRDGLHERLVKKMAAAEKLTAHNKLMSLVIALNYSGQWDITQACQSLLENNQSVSVNAIQSNLSTSHLPCPDLLIRTSGEKRISNFMLWQLAYTELYFTDVLWPDFNGVALRAAMTHFAKRSRRYGAN